MRKFPNKIMSKTYAQKIRQEKRKVLLNQVNSKRQIASTFHF